MVSNNLIFLAVKYPKIVISVPRAEKGFIPRPLFSDRGEGRGQKNAVEDEPCIRPRYRQYFLPRSDDVNVMKDRKH